MSSADLLLKYQRRLLETVSTHALTVVEKSRRIGATWALAFLAVLTSAASKAAGGSNVYYLGTSLEMAREFIQACADWAAGINEIAGEAEEFIFEDLLPSGETRSMQALRIRMASGYVIEALPSTPRALRGRQGLVLIDEAAFVTDLEEILKAALALTMWGGRVVVLSTHDGADNPFAALVEDVRAGRVTGAGLVRITFDDAVGDGLYERIKFTGRHGGRTKDEWITLIRGIYRDNADEELDVIPRTGGGAYFKASLLAQVRDPQIPVIRWTAPADLLAAGSTGMVAVVDDWIEDVLAAVIDAMPVPARSVLGTDFGRTVDATCIWALAEVANQWITPFVVELRNVPFKAQERILVWLGKGLGRLHHMALDATGNGAALAEAMTLEFGGRRVSEIKLSTEWYREHMPRCKAAMEDGDLPVPADPDVEADYRAIELIRGVPQVGSRRSKGRDGLPRHGDTVIAAALAIFARDQRGGPSGPIGSLEDGDVDHQDERAVISDYVGALSGTLDDYRRM